MKASIYILVDYRGHFYSSTRSRGASVRVGRLEQLLRDFGFEVVTRHFHDVDFRHDDYSDAWVVYQSSEDRDLFYKDYIEDILLGLQLQGARLIPNLYEFRAHHNKVFMEIYRDLRCLEPGKTIKAKGYGTLEAFRANLHSHPGELVLKPSAGALSAGVRLARTDRAKVYHAARLSRTLHWLDWCKDRVNRIIRQDYRPKSWHRKQFIVQDFIPGLTGDYKVLVYGNKYYVLDRQVRKGDFRASGSGFFSYPEKPPYRVLDFAQGIFAGFDVPFISLDVADAGERLHLLEFQFLSFGSYTLERSHYYYRRAPNGWEQVSEAPDLEREIATSLASFINRKMSTLRA